MSAVESPATPALVATGIRGPRRRPGGAGGPGEDSADTGGPRRLALPHTGAGDPRALPDRPDTHGRLGQRLGLDGDRVTAVGGQRRLRRLGGTTHAILSSGIAERSPTSRSRSATTCTSSVFVVPLQTILVPLPRPRRQQPTPQGPQLLPHRLLLPDGDQLGRDHRAVPVPVRRRRVRERPPRRSSASPGRTGPTIPNGLTWVILGASAPGGYRQPSRPRCLNHGVPRDHLVRLARRAVDRDDRLHPAGHLDLRRAPTCSCIWRPCRTFRPTSRRPPTIDGASAAGRSCGSCCIPMLRPDDRSSSSPSG